MPPLIAVIAFLILERIRFTEKIVLTKRNFIFLIIELVAISISLLISIYLLKPLVNFYSIFEIISLSDISIPRPISIVLAILLIDFTNYLIHRVSHKIPYLWKLHRLHHSDKKVDAVTTFLHHPFEIMVNSLLIIALYVVFDIPVVVIVWFSYFGAVHSAFTHTELLIPEKIDRYLKYFIITPNIHRIHHSQDMKEGNSNFGNVFPWWDILFKTYTSKTKKELMSISFGIADKESPKTNTLKNLLINPFI